MLCLTWQQRRFERTLPWWSRLNLSGCYVEHLGFPNISGNNNNNNNDQHPETSIPHFFGTKLLG